MVFRGTGYNYPDSHEIYDLMRHRRRQVEALALKARRDDARAELERELAELDRDIAAGIEELDRMEARRRERLARTLRARIERDRST